MLRLEGNNYLIESGDQEFTNRQKTVFDQLDAVISKNGVDNTNTHNLVMEIDNQPDISSKKRKRAETKHLRGQESIFKRPDLPSPVRRNHNLPDFRRNPHKWTKYSLNDVSEDDMSERSNTAAAMSFLQEMESRRNVEMEDKSEDKIVFKRPPKSRNSISKTVVETSSSVTVTENDTTHFRGSKLVMPEYVVGKKPVKKNKSNHKAKTESSHNQIQLNHLLDEEAE
ncbi:protein TSSC4 [Nilaparvata lugens]|uniref:protein TSSC4 n=1 Tax=Nilaparvata lugens TaxID=108931 RepID=UPI00193E9A67|nr:protein TSSC4 [Nilaparvata lugens]